jgi:hypothetical protein
MKHSKWLAAVALGVAAASFTPTAAQAQRYDRDYDRDYSYSDRYVPYSSYRFYRGRGADIARREALRSRLIDVGERVNRADARGAISRRDARDLYRQLDRVRDLLVSDRMISRSEYERWMSDLRDIRAELRDDREDFHPNFRSRSYNYFWR